MNSKRIVMLKAAEFRVQNYRKFVDSGWIPGERVTSEWTKTQTHLSDEVLA